MRRTRWLAVFAAGAVMVLAAPPLASYARGLGCDPFLADCGAAPRAQALADAVGSLRDAGIGIALVALFALVLPERTRLPVARATLIALLVAALLMVVGAYVVHGGDQARSVPDGREIAADGTYVHVGFALGTAGLLVMGLALLFVLVGLPAEFLLGRRPKDGSRV